MYCLIAIALGTTVSFIFAPWIFQILLLPAPPNLDPVFTEVTEMVGTYMKVAFLGGIILTLPFLVLQGILFIVPGLRTKERRSLFFLLPGTTIFFSAGVVFSYFILLPPALHFLLTFGGDIATPFIRIGNYIGIVVRLLFWIGLAFETPFVLFILAQLGVVTPQKLKKGRRFAIVAAFVLGALITPTFDPVNQSLVAIPILVLYEIGIWLAKLAASGKGKVIEPPKT